MADRELPLAEPQLEAPRLGDLRVRYLTDEERQKIAEADASNEF